jgi:hypothetical protein
MLRDELAVGFHVTLCNPMSNVVTKKGQIQSAYLLEIVGKFVEILIIWQKGKSLSA